MRLRNRCWPGRRHPAIPATDGNIKVVKERFESSLFDIRQLVQADLFDSELEAAEELAKNRFSRAAGAVAGVVLDDIFCRCVTTISSHCQEVTYDF